MDDDREKLACVLSRVCKLSIEHLIEVENLLDRLESGSRDTMRAAEVRESDGSPRRVSGAPTRTPLGTTVTDDWPHAPVHRLEGRGTFIVTAGTLHKQHFFKDPMSLDWLQSELLKHARRYEWQLEAWAVFSNHYHFVGHALVDADSLRPFLTHLHGNTARYVNQRDGAADRPVWFNFWETRLTYLKAYHARLKYVHFNAVRHRLVSEASHYPWCSAAWFERVATRAQVRTIYSYKIEKVKVFDDFDPIVGD